MHAYWADTLPRCLYTGKTNCIIHILTIHPNLSNLSGSGGVEVGEDAKRFFDVDTNAILNLTV